MRWTRACLGMHPAVRELYKRYIFAGKDYPAGLDVVRRRVKVGLCCSRQKKTQKEKKTKGAMIGQLHLLFFLSLLLALTQPTHTHNTRALTLLLMYTHARTCIHSLNPRMAAGRVYEEQGLEGRGGHYPSCGAGTLVF